MTNKPSKSNDTVQEMGERVRDIISQGNARRLVLRTAEGNKLIELSLTAAVVIGALLVMFLPGGMFFAFLALAAGIVLKLRVEVLRELTDSDDVIEVKSKHKDDE